MIKFNKHLVAFLSMMSATLFFGWRPIANTFALAWQNDEYTHILLILPVCIVLILLEKQFLQNRREWDFHVGPLILAMAIAFALGTWLCSASLSNDEQLSIQMFVLVLMWIGTFLICFGRQTGNRLLFPLLLLFGLVPLPQFALDLIITLLQQGSAWSTRALFALFNVPVIQHGVELTIPGLTIQIAEECSSIRSSSMLVVATLVMAYLLLRSPWRRFLISALAIPLSVVKNGLRIFVIAMLGTRVDPGYLTGRLHHQGGILYLLIALIIEFAFCWWLRRGDDSSVNPDLELLREPGMSV
jgi:exosortase